MDIINKGRINVSNLVTIAKRKGFKVFVGQTDLNLWVIRSGDKQAKTFDDVLVLFYMEADQWKLKQFSCTSNPGEPSLFKSKNPLGTAIIDFGQYLKAYTWGFHKGKKDHPAFIQTGEIKVIRDFNNNGCADFVIPIFDKIDVWINKMNNSSTVTDFIKDGKVVYRTEQGYFGCNIHRANKGILSYFIGNWSEGCIVHADEVKYMKEYKDIIETYVATFGKQISLTVIHENEFKTI